MANSVEALALIMAAEKNNNASSRAMTRRMITPPGPKFDLVPGQFFGVIYGLEGERMGPGYMGEDNQRVLMNSKEGTEKAKGAAHGRKRRPRYGKVVAYIGERRVPSLLLIRSASVSVSAALPPPASSATSQHPPEEVDVQIGDDQLALLPAEAQPGLQDARAIPRGRMYVGDRSVLDKGTHVPMDELIARGLREEEEDLAWGGPLSDPPSMEDQDDAAVPARQGVAHSTLDVQYAIAIALHTLQGSPKDQAKVAADAVRG